LRWWIRFLGRLGVEFIDENGVAPGEDYESGNKNDVALPNTILDRCRRIQNERESQKSGPSQIALLRSGKYGPTIKAATECTFLSSTAPR
jgi:hypothetical protein